MRKWQKRNPTGVVGFACCCGCREHGMAGAERSSREEVARWAARSVIAAAVAAVCMGQAMVVVNGGDEDDSEAEKGFTVPKADTKTIDKLDDFDRYVGKKAWELAFRAMN